MPPTVHSIHTILAQFREDSIHNRDMGDRFERLVKRFLEVDPLYKERFKKVWLWKDFPHRHNAPDHGIDLVAEDVATGKYCAIQAKFFDPENTLSKPDIDSFLSASGKDIYTSRILVTTTNKIGSNLEHTLRDQSVPVQKITISDFENSSIDWSLYDPQNIEKLHSKPKKNPLPHQIDAIDDVMEGLNVHDRGKLIMACGTGKTFTSLQIAEKVAGQHAVLFLVPSLALLSQSLREWSTESRRKLKAIAVCSDQNIGRKVTKTSDDQADINISDLSFPATTRASEIIHQFHQLQIEQSEPNAPEKLTVVFSTYQSIAAVSKAQELGLPEFDLIICDEAHRTTGVTLTDEEDSHFIKVHDNNYIKAKKRLYMTATPRIYAPSSKLKAKENDALICSMDDEASFGPEFHNLSFGTAVTKGLLSDYKVLVLAVNEKHISQTYQKAMANDDKDLDIEEAAKIIGCWNGLAKRVNPDDESYQSLLSDPGVMRRAVAFCRQIKDSKAFVERFKQLMTYQENKAEESANNLICEADHVDGTFPALARAEKLDWLKASTDENQCRILSNARCLSEGVDVPSLDAVLFIHPRKSQIDVVQSVGRVMRLAPGKKYGYIILPVAIPSNLTPEEALKDNKRFDVVWQILQALRSHDDRFDAIINQIDLNKTRPPQIQVISVGGEDPAQTNTGDGKDPKPPVQPGFIFANSTELKDAIYAKVVIKCGRKEYWETWAKDVAKIAERLVRLIKITIEDPESSHGEAFKEFVAGLRANLNPSISNEDAIEMLAQHMLTQPVFDALFGNYEFTKRNPVSISMQKMLDSLDSTLLKNELTKLDKFYDSVRLRAKGIDNSEGRQKVVIELYDKFFRTAFPRVAERLGIVYTPIEVVDFIIQSVQDVLKEEFGTEIGGEDVHIIDPFTGTGTFIVRLLQSGLISPEDLVRKYTKELHANEIILLAYYIAAINIEEAFHRLHLENLALPEGEKPDYLPFEGIVLTDTFQLAETQFNSEDMTFPENNVRAKKQKTSPIRVVIGNPPYSAGQESENDGNKAMRYPRLDGRIKETYAVGSTATLLRNLYDSYVLALRWASDRISEKGVVAFVTNGSFIDGNAMDGVRKSLTGEFSKLYIYNLRGNQRTQGEISRAEGGKIFGSGSRAGIAISVLIRDPKHQGECELFYKDIGDSLSREEKLSILRVQKSIQGVSNREGWTKLVPNKQNDWINHRDPAFRNFCVLGDKDDLAAMKFFENYAQGVLSSRDKWVYNFSKSILLTNVTRMVHFFNAESDRMAELLVSYNIREAATFVEENLNNDETKISWSRGLKSDIVKGKLKEIKVQNVVKAMYRPFCKTNLYFDRALNEMVYQIPKLFPTPNHPNLIIAVDSRGSTKEFSAFASALIPDYEMISKGQCFPLYVYEPIETEGKDKSKQSQAALMDDDPEVETIVGYRRKSAITDAILTKFRDAYESKISKEDIFYYVYGVLHSLEYRKRFASDLKKMLPRIPLTQETEDFWKFSKAGRDLAYWHLNYETIEPFELQETSSALAVEPFDLYRVEEMKFAKNGKEVDKTTIQYNAQVTLAGIPLEAYDYVVNGRSALAWIMERYKVSIDPASGIKNDPNDWCREHNDPRYIVDLVKRIVRVSIETMKIVNALPSINEKV